MVKISSIIPTLILFFLAFSPSRSFAQYYYYNDKYYDSPFIIEIGASLGSMNSLTDLGGQKGTGKKFIKDINLGNAAFAGGAYAGLMYNNMIGIRIEGTYTNISASDSILVGKTDAISAARYNRNLSFRSKLTEIMVLAEFHPLAAFLNRETPPRFSPYVLGGIGQFFFNPQAKINNEWISLQPLSTEGQGFSEYPDRKPYALNGFCIPIGFGFKYDISTIANIKGEFLYRSTNTDYLDDVSTTYIDKTLYPRYFAGDPVKINNALQLTDRQRGLDPNQTADGAKRGNPSQNDNYFSFSLKMAFTLMGRQRIKPKQKQWSCYW
jgi:hypothetical protein